MLTKSSRLPSQVNWGKRKKKLCITGWKLPPLISLELFLNLAGIHLFLSLRILFDFFYNHFHGLLLWSFSGHSAVNIGNSKIVVFGGLVDKKFLSDIAVYDIGTYASYFIIYGIILFCYFLHRRVLNFGPIFCIIIISVVWSIFCLCLFLIRIEVVFWVVNTFLNPVFMILIFVDIVNRYYWLRS